MTPFRTLSMLLMVPGSVSATALYDTDDSRSRSA
eukprot:CAMPEP_0197439278 /NCGR_PEP_ID=MMETSP1175-20131217/6060_1 /TAXON_ID=1003142 /ORGANISM="Triceratium dubium, Strain CCMP147" /LENGTH=33 /DNA_ID= /DNA_START= /DNA_END= /DNA_ORIENTATION=